MKTTRSAAKSKAKNHIHAERHDIVLGKGNGIKNHPGNVEFRAIVHIYSWEYDCQAKAAKRAYAEDLGFIIVHGPDAPRRVLESVDGTVERCIEVEDPDAIVDVVMHRLRNGRRARARASKKQPVLEDLSEKQLGNAVNYFLK